MHRIIYFKSIRLYFLSVVKLFRKVILMETVDDLLYEHLNKRIIRFRLICLIHFEEYDCKCFFGYLIQEGYEI